MAELFMGQNNQYDDIPELIDVEPKNEAIPDFTRDSCTYTKQYCEENVWYLCKRFIEDHPDIPAYAVFISNPQKTVAIWHQKSSQDEESPVVWDYHVVLAAFVGSAPQTPNGSNHRAWWVWDLDTTLPFPCAAPPYFRRAFRPSGGTRTPYLPSFRVIPASDFLARFASDRRHMRIQGQWLAPPPATPALRGELAVADFNLQDYINMLPVETEEQRQEAQKQDENSPFHGLAEKYELSSNPEGMGVVLNLTNLISTFCGSSDSFSELLLAAREGLNFPFLSS
mmetsp:Transcript_2587/g.4208  ORF Transcript_2587/g.4208 Transcript_2587/m.4208 type:complete len:282 (+) Transcript_2587:80-925(+)